MSPTHTRNLPIRRNLTAVLSRTLIGALMLCLALPLSADDEQDRVPPALLRGITDFGDGDFSSALLAFREILLDPQLEVLQADAYYWIGKSYLALTQYADAGRNFDLYLQRYPGHLFVEEARYQQGRLFYLQGEPERSIVSLAEFVQEFPQSEFAASAYFWIGEALFLVGELDTSREMFATVVDQFPRSAKVEASRYRTSVIDLRKRETELLRLLKWSHEESLRLSEQFQRRDADLEQEVASFQRRIVEMQSDDQVAAVVQREQQIEELETELAALRLELVDAQAETAQALANQTSSAQAEQASATLAGSESELAVTRELLRLKQEALQIQQELREFVALGDSG